MEAAQRPYPLATEQRAQGKAGCAHPMGSSRPWQAEAPRRGGCQSAPRPTDCTAPVYFTTLIEHRNYSVQTENKCSVTTKSEAKLHGPVSEHGPPLAETGIPSPPRQERGPSQTPLSGQTWFLKARQLRPRPKPSKHKINKYGWSHTALRRKDTHPAGSDPRKPGAAPRRSESSHFRVSPKPHRAG